MSKLDRLHKVLAHAGIGSRRQCEQYILEGRVKVDGVTVTRLGTSVDPSAVELRFDGRSVRPQRTMTYMVHKPAGVICTNEDELADPKGERRPRKKVIDLIPGLRERVYTIGRLDRDSEGLILVTNDGEFCNLLTHPRYEVPKTYHVIVKGAMTPEMMHKIQRGVWLSDPRSARGGRKTSPARIRINKSFRDGAVLEVTLHEGLNREVRRVFAGLGVEVTHLKRIRLGSLSLDHLGRGQFRPLTDAEIRALKACAKSIP